MRVAIYHNDHSPAHVHVIGPGWSVVIELTELRLREVVGGTERDARDALRLVASSRASLLDAWE